MPRPTLAKLAGVFLKVGNTTFGGGPPTMAALEREFVERYRWLGHEEYGLAFALARLTPGTNVMAFCAATGWQILGWAGAVAGTLSVTLPSAVIAVLITVGYENWRTNPWALAAINGTVAAVAGMMLATVFVLVKPYTAGLRGTGLMQTVRAIVLSGAAFVLLYKFKLSPLKIIGLLAVAGLLWHDPVDHAQEAAADVTAKEPAPQ
jgi:chromate transporter